MIICSRAPVRIDLLGGWTDVSPFAEREGGAVVNMTINRYTYATLRTRPGAGVRIQSADYATAIEAATIRQLEYDGTLDVVKAALKRLDINPGLELTMRADAPPGSGLGTSAALGVALIGVLNVLQAERLSPHEVAALATQLEVDELGIAGGKQDQLAAALGGINFMEFGDQRPVTSPLSVSAGVINELEKRMVLCYSGTSRLSGDIIQRVQHAYVNGEPATCRALRTIRDLARRAKTVLLSGALDEFGSLLRENWICQRALHVSVTNADIDRLFTIAEQHGALGGKACGAGGGGCLVFFCAMGAERAVRQALTDAGGVIIDFNIDRYGLQTWRIDEATGQVE